MKDQMDFVQLLSVFPETYWFCTEPIDFDEELVGTAQEPENEGILLITQLKYSG